MPSFSAESRATLASLASRADKEISNSRSIRDIETERSRQIDYLRFCKLKLLGGEDPCGTGIDYEKLLACYTTYLVDGNNIKNLELRAETVKLYLSAVNALFKARGFPPPVNFKDPHNRPAQLYRNCKKWQKLPARRHPLTPQMFSIMFTLAAKGGPDSFAASLLDWALVGRGMGQRCAEFGQKKQFVAEFHQTPRGVLILKAFMAGDIKFYDAKDHWIKNVKSHGCRAVKFRAHWRIQKNRRNGEEADFAADHDNPELCMVQAMLRIVLRARRLRRPRNSPLGVFRDGRSGKVKYLTGNKISAFFKSVAKQAHPTLTEEELKKYSAHSIRVTAAVLLHQAGKLPDYIKIRLRWVGESYRLYLRNTERLMMQHVKALDSDSKMIAALRQVLTTLPDSVAYSAQEDDSMGEYISF